MATLTKQNMLCTVPVVWYGTSLHYMQLHFYYFSCNIVMKNESYHKICEIDIYIVTEMWEVFCCYLHITYPITRCPRKNPLPVTDYSYYLFPNFYKILTTRLDSALLKGQNSLLLKRMWSTVVYLLVNDPDLEHLPAKRWNGKTGINGIYQLQSWTVCKVLF